MKTVAAVLVNFKGWRDTVRCLESITELAYPHVDVVVVENASNDESAAEILRAFERLKQSTAAEPAGTDEPSARTYTLLEQSENLGFSGGNNAGIEYAAATLEADYIWLINNDTVVDRLALTELVAAFETSARAGGRPGFCGSLIVDMGAEDRVQAYGGGLVRPLIGMTRQCQEGASVESVRGSAEAFSPDYISGCSLLFAVPNIPVHGVLDDTYFLYWEDTEWSYRCRRAGLELVVAPASVVCHSRGATSGKFPVVGYYNTRNCLRFLREYHPFLSIVTIAIRPIVLGLLFLKNRNRAFLIESMRGYATFLREWMIPGSQREGRRQ